MTDKICDWIVRVYDREDCVKWWTIKNRSERQAESEAMADIIRDFNGKAPSGSDYDWTMVEDKPAAMPTNNEIMEAFDRFFGL